MSVAVWVGREERRTQWRKKSSHSERSKEGNDQRDIIIAFLSPVKKTLGSITFLWCLFQVDKQLAVRSHGDTASMVDGFLHCCLSSYKVCWLKDKFLAFVFYFFIFSFLLNFQQTFTLKNKRLTGTDWERPKLQWHIFQGCSVCLWGPTLGSQL